MLIQSPKNQKLFKSFLVGHDQKMGVANLVPGTNSCKLKDIWKFWGWAWPKKGLASVVTGIWNWLYVKNELMEWILHVDADSQIIKTNQNFFLGEHSQKLVCGHGTQQLTLSQKWADGIDWYPALWLLNAGGSLWLYFSLFVYLFCLMSFQLFSAP